MYDAHHVCLADSTVAPGHRRLPCRCISGMLAQHKRICNADKDQQFKALIKTWERAAQSLRSAELQE